MTVRFPIIALATTTLLLVTSAQAQYTGPSAASAVSVEEILKNPVDDQEVQLTGHILRQISGKNYIFSDGTSEIVAEIKAKRFEGMPKIDEKVKVEILGEVDTSRYRAPEIEVEAIRILE